MGDTRTGKREVLVVRPELVKESQTRVDSLAVYFGVMDGHDLVPLHLEEDALRDGRDRQS